MQHNATHKHTQKKAEYIITKKHQHNHHHHQTKTQTQTQVNMQALHEKKDNPPKKKLKKKTGRYLILPFAWYWKTTTPTTITTTTTTTLLGTVIPAAGLQMAGREEVIAGYPGGEEIELETVSARGTTSFPSNVFTPLPGVWPEVPPAVSYG